MQVKEENGNYICLKHNQMIQLIVMDKGIQPADQMLCLMCMQLNRQPMNQVVGVEQAKEIIKEKLNQKTEGQDERITQKVNRLRTLVQNMNELRQQLLMNIDIINRQIDQWINDLNNQIKKENIDLIKGLQQLQQEQVKEESNNTYINKIDLAFKKLINIDGIQKCYQDLMNINNEQIEQLNKQQSNSEQIVKKQLGPINYKLISQVKQEEYSQAIAFNNSGSIMVAGSKYDIKVWQFDKGKMTELKLLKGELDWIKCLLFSKKNQWFISGDDGGIIKSWKKGSNNSEWLSQQAEKKHTNAITCIILTNNEAQLISGSYDNTIIVRSVNYQTNQIKYQYSLEKNHSSWILGLSLNESETLLVSCSSDNQLILWTKEQNNKWIYKNSVKLSHYLSRVCFVEENQLLVQQDGRGFTNVFRVVNQQLQEQEDLKITLNVPKNNSDSCLFPTIYNKSKEIIIQKSHEYVYIIRKQSDGTFKVEGQPIYCETYDNYGNLTCDGEHLVIWNEKTKEFRIYKISYGQ